MLMFNFLKPNPVKKLRNSYDKKLTEAMLAQRKGDIRSYAMLTAEAEEVWSRLEALEQEK